MGTGISIRVSSRHMILASNVFRVMLSPKFKEGNILQAKGLLEVPLPDDNPAALLTLLNVIHGHVRKVPRKVNLQLLTDIAILVDKYEFHECVELFAEIWIEDLKNTTPAKYKKEPIPWLCISWVFKREAEFQNMTRIAEWQSTYKLRDSMDWSDQYPIPESVVA